MKRSKVRIPVKSGKLLGYHLDDPAKSRRLVLVKISKKDTWGKVVKRLNVLYIYNKKSHPLTAKKARSDMYYIQKYFEKKSKSRSRKSKRSGKSRKLKRSKKY